MVQFSNVLLAIDNAYTVPQRALNCRPGLGGLSQVYGPNHQDKPDLIVKSVFLSRRYYYTV